jgi:hypothetical protein
MKNVKKVLGILSIALLTAILVCQISDVDKYIVTILLWVEILVLLLGGVEFSIIKVDESRSVDQARPTSADRIRLILQQLEVLNLLASNFMDENVVRTPIANRIVKLVVELDKTDSAVVK